MIRPATLWDAPKIVDMWFDMIQEAIDNESIKEEHSNKESLLITLFCRIKDINWKIDVIEENSIIIGFVMGQLHYPMYSQCHKIVTGEALYVAHGYRGKKYHKVLINSLVKWAEDNEAAIGQVFSNYDYKIKHFYESEGFVPVQIVYRKKLGG